MKQTKKIVPVFDTNKKVRFPDDMPAWVTSRHCFITHYSHISRYVFDSTWESTESYVIEKNPHVVAWAKNDHLGFEITYVFKVSSDFLLRLDNGKILVLETKGQEIRKDKEKRKALAECVESA